MTSGRDYRRRLQFGVFASPATASVAETLELARLADELGIDVLGVQDHPYQSRHLDAQTLITALAARTRRLRVFLDVGNLPLRAPAMLAKATATLSVLTGGRVELGLGAGAFWEAIEAMGGSRRVPAEAVAALDEAIAVCRLMWSGQRAVRFAGQHYRLAGAHPGPAPPGKIGIWLGALGPRMLELTGRAADGWVVSSSYVPPPALADAHARIDDAASAAGRHPAEVQRVYNLAGRIDGDGGYLGGPADQWVDELAELALEQGMDTFVLAPEGDPTHQLRRFADDVVPAVLAAVSRHRAEGEGRPDTAR